MDEQIVAGRYRLVSIVGRGAMGVVWRAHDTTLNRSVAVKMLRRDYAVDASSAARMHREAQLAAQLRDLHVVTVYDLHIDDDQSFVVMEYVPGSSLADRLAGAHLMTPAEAGGIVAQVARGLAAAHQAGIIHRDIKPANVLIAGDGVAKLADFGIARGVEDTKMTVTGQLVGTLAFMAPEVVRGQPATAASDVWSLGATLFHAIEGRAPYDDDSGDRHPPTMMLRIVSDPPNRPRAAGALGPVIERMLDRDPSRRPTASEAADELDRALQSDGPASDPGATAAGPARRVGRRSVAALFGVAVVAVASAIAIAAAPGSARNGHHATTGQRSSVSPSLRPSTSATPLQATLFSKRTATLTFPDNVWAIAGSSRTPLVYVLGDPGGHGVITVVDASTGSRVATIAMTQTSAGGLAVSPDGTRLYAVDNDGIAMLSTSARKQIGHVFVSGGNSGLVVSPDGKHLYALNTQYTKVVVTEVSTSPFQVERQFAVPHALSVSGLAISPDGRAVYTVTDNPVQTEGRVTAISTSTGKVLRQVTFAQPSSVAVSPDGTHLFVSSDDAASAPTVAVLSSATLATTRHIVVPGTACVTAPAPGALLVYELCSPNGDTGSVIAYSAGTYVQRDSTPVGFQPMSFSFSPDGAHFVVAGSSGSSSSGQVVILSR